MKKACFVTILSMLLLLQGAPLRASDYAVGADLSFLKQAEDRGKVFKDNGAAKPGLEIFKDHGYNWIRLRLFHTPVELPNNLEYTIALAKAAKKLGFHFLQGGFRIHQANDIGIPRGGSASGHGPNR